MFRNVLLLGLLAALPGCGVAESSGVDAGDAQVIQALKEAGSNLSKPHPIDFYFVEFADRASAERFDRDWDQASWKLDVHQMPGLSEWTVIASTVMVPDLQAISDLSARFNVLAPKYGADYDGWEAAVTQ